MFHFLFNAFSANVPYLYPLKTSENPYVFRRYTIEHWREMGYQQTTLETTFSIKDFFSNCDKICSFLWIWFTEEIVNGKLHFLCSDWPYQLKLFKVSEYPFKHNKNIFKKYGSAIIYIFYNISLNVLRLTFFNIYNLPFLRSPNIGKIKVRVGSKTDYFSYILSSSTNKIAVFNNFFSLIYSQPREKQNCAHAFLLPKYFLNNLLLIVFMQNTLSKLVELLQ